MNGSVRQRRQEQVGRIVVVATVVLVLIVAAVIRTQQRNCAPTVTAKSTDSFADVPFTYWAYTAI